MSVKMDMKAQVRKRLVFENEIPTLPAEWNVERLRFLLSESKERNGSEPVGEMLSVSEYRGVVPKEYEHEEHRRSDAELENYRVVRPGQLAVNSMWLNHLGLGVSEHLGHVSPAYGVYDVSPRLDLRFLHHLLRSNYYLKIYLRYLYGIRPSSFQIKSYDWASIPIIVPDLATQKRIAAFLDRETTRIDALIAKKERLVDAQNARLTAKLQKMVLGGASVQRGLGGDWLQNLPDEWTLTPLKHLVTVMGGATPSKDREDFWVGDIPWVSPKDMKVDVIYDVPDHVSEDAVNGSALNKIPAEAVLIVVRGMILARFVPVCRLGAEATINQDMKALLPRNKVIRGDYLQRMLQGFGDVLMSFTEEAAHGTKKLRSEALFGIKFSLPPLDQQEAISVEYEHARVLTERIVESTQSSITHLREYRAALITAAVTGQVDVDSYTRSGASSAQLDQIEEEMQG